MSSQSPATDHQPLSKEAPQSAQPAAPQVSPNIDGELVVVPPKTARTRPQALCEYCNINKSQVIRPKSGDKVCKDCFCFAFEEEIHQTIVANALFSPGQKIVLGASGGKDSTVLAHVMTTLNARHDYGLEMHLLSIDEGIQGYRDDSLETVKRNQQQYQLPLHIISYADIYNGWTMDKIVKAIGNKNNCTFCGVFRRQALDRGAQLIGADMLLTGHNCDDLAETVLLNLLRGDIQRAGRCVSIITGKNSSLPRAKPLKYAYEKEIVMYAYLLHLDYFATECKYAPFAFRGYAREYIKDLERIRPRNIVDIVIAAESFQLPSKQGTTANKCQTCGYLCAQKQCKACLLLSSLEAGTAKDVQSKRSGVQNVVTPPTRVQECGNCATSFDISGKQQQNSCKSSNDPESTSCETKASCCSYEPS